ncbi:uncharacterized protein N7482_008595 [Penicillium canariense]|uniref:Uncharacterized protein n=1 Tax=Penicillium canariense TaxID=189055 RepID=A0A9W9LJ52_9EURO|nr:uncharacterized protein N7482_008595 [Penicillium canariense]KAJ5157495.1 hypothetical protein N7482_008595 [Penicillium canariense]
MAYDAIPLLAHSEHTKLKQPIVFKTGSLVSRTIVILSAVRVPLLSSAPVFGSNAVPRLLGFSANFARMVHPVAGAIRQADMTDKTDGIGRTATEEAEEREGEREPEGEVAQWFLYAIPTFPTFTGVRSGSDLPGLDIPNDKLRGLTFPLSQQALTSSLGSIWDSLSGRFSDECQGLRGKPSP